MMKRSFLTASAAGVILLLLTSFLQAQTAEQNTYLRLVKEGMESIKNGNYESARDSFNEALRYHDAHDAAHLGLGVAYFKLGEYADAERELSRAADINPKEPGSYQFLGELYYLRDDLGTAAAYWEKAVRADPSNDALRARLDRIRREQQTERDFNRDLTSHFLVKYEGRERIEAGRIILRILEEAYGEIGRSLGYYPDREVQVILYSTEQFQEVTNAPDWSGAVYDGKIRIPIAGIEKETPGLRRLLFHEYTHAVVRAMTPRCPTWLNEGLAQYFERKEIDVRQKAALRKMAADGKLPSLSSLEGSFIGLSGDQAGLAYFFSLSAVRFLIDDFGMYRVKGILEELGAGADTGKAVDRAMSISFEEFERGWKASLK